LSLNSERDKWTPATVLDALQRPERELGRQPTSQDLVRPPAGYPNTAVIARELQLERRLRQARLERPTARDRRRHRDARRAQT
jgi:hypothetical protein